MANTRELVKRRKAIRNIRKITRTMELIATARFKKAMDRTIEADAYTRKIAELAADLSANAGDIKHPLLVPQPDTETPLRRRHIPHAPTPVPILLTLVTSLFLHGSPLHLAGNMLFLWIFGGNVEEVLGTFRYLLVYVACGVMGTLGQVAANPDSIIPTLGASGAIAGRD